MASGFGNRQRVRTDRFGRPTVLRALGNPVDRDKNVLSNLYEGYVELGKQLYKVEISPRNKPMTKKGVEVDSVWCKVTKVNANQQNVSI